MSESFKNIDLEPPPALVQAPPARRYMQSFTGAILDITDPAHIVELDWIDMMLLNPRPPSGIVTNEKKLKQFYKIDANFFGVP